MTASYHAIDTSVCIHDEDIVPEPHALLGGAVADLRVLRRCDDGSLRSGLIRLPAGWIAADGAPPDATVQLFVRSGAIRADLWTLGRGGFLAIPAGSPAPRIEALEPTELVAIFDAPASRAPAEIVIIEDALAIEPFTPVIAGRRLDGFERRVLWLDAETGADTRLLRVPAGFNGPGPNFHPVNEEIFCLEGDIAPDETRPMRAGSYLWNPARSVHGFDEHTVSGCMLLEWHDGPWALTPTPEVTRP